MAAARPLPPSAEPAACAKSAGLCYVSDQRPGIQRRRRGRGFEYVEPAGRPVRDRETLARIARLAIPPAWTEVWICPDPQGHLQATGRDARGRKQYRYHPRWSAVRDETKFERLLELAAALPGLRRRIARDLGRPGLPREKVLAAVVRLLERTLVRVGNDEYARENESFGLTTLRNRHARVRGVEVRFRFRGKSGVEHEIALADRRLARIIRRCQELPHQELFNYLDADGELRDVSSEDVNQYLRNATGRDFTAKDFRTWAGTVLCARALRQLGPASSTGRANKNIVAAIREVAAELGNTQAVCRRAYIHPEVLAAYLAREVAEVELDRRPGRAGARRGLDADEQALVRLLRRRATRRPPRNVPKAWAG